MHKILPVLQLHHLPIPVYATETTPVAPGLGTDDNRTDTSQRCRLEPLLDVMAPEMV